MDQARALLEETWKQGEPLLCVTSVIVEHWILFTFELLWFQKKSNVTANANDFELIKEEPNHFDDEYENIDPNEFDQNESVPAKSQMNDPTGAKRAKLMDELTNDEFTLFGFFVANELRNLKTAHFRGELKRAIQKCLFEVAEKEAATTAVEHNWVTWSKDEKYPRIGEAEYLFE